MFGHRNRRQLWQFLWHPCFDGCIRNRQNMPGSESGKRQELPVTPPKDEKQPEKDTKPADIADDNRQNLPTITGKNCLLRGRHNIYRISSLEGEENSLSHELSEEFNTPDAPTDALDERPISLLDILCRDPDGNSKARAPDSVLEDCDRLAAQYGQGLVMHYLEVIEKSSIRGAKRIMPYLENCLENHKGQAVKQTNGSRSGPPSREFGA